MGDRLRDMAFRYGAAAAGVVAMTAVVGAVLSVAPPTSKVSTVYVIVVLLAATRLGRGPAILASVASFVVYDFLFTTPYHELTISDPDEWVSLVLFLVTALVTSQVAANERARAEEATRRERESALLLDVLRAMTQPDLDRSLQVLAGRVRAQLHVPAARIELTVGDRHLDVAAGPAEVVALARPDGHALDVLPGVREPTATASARTRGWVRVLPPHPGEGFDVLGGWRRSVVPVRVGDETVGRITLVQRSAAVPVREDRFLAVVATQLSLLAQRATLEVAATEADVLRRASDLKTALLNAVSHDLRTPLASILASAEGLLQEDAQWSDEDRSASVREIVAEARRLDHIVGSLLDLSRIEAGALQPAKRLYDLPSLLADVTARFDRDAAAGRIRVHADPDLPPVPLDPVEIDQVLSNLLENALKNAAHDTPVDLSAQVVAGEAIVEVADRGPGVPLADAAHVFDAFYRVRRDEPGPRGVGLGLAVARGLVEAHGGRIWVEAREGGGAAFRFALPLAGAPLVEREPALT